MTRETKAAACCASGACETGDCAKSSGLPLFLAAAALAALWGVTGNTGWLMLAGISAAAGAVWWLAAKWANRPRRRA